MESKKQVLVVDDIPENIDVLFNVLKYDYEVIVAKNGKDALNMALNGAPPDLILLDVMMPEMDGFEVCSKLKSSFSTQNVPVIFVTAKDDEIDEYKGFALGAVDYIIKPIKPSIVLTRVKTQIALNDQKKHLEYIVKERTKELERTRLTIIHRLGRAAEFKDNETGMHVIRMSKYTQVIGIEAGLTIEESELLLNVVPMHDIGKIGIPDKILLKPGKLDPDEWELMKQHTTIGADILGDDESILIKEARICALTHHEKWDGTGYPNGLSGEDIPFYGRIAAIADVFDALTSERTYKKAWTVEDAVEYIRNEKGKHFDPKLVDIFLGIVPKIIDIKETYKD